MARAKQYDFDALFEPAHVAVVGVSLSSPFHPANIIYNKNFYGSSCEVYAVNPKGGQVERRPVYRSVKEVPVTPDMAVLAVKAAQVPRVAEECAEVGVRSLVVISGGFSETGGEGRELERELVETCSRAGITLIGPNCFGVYSPPWIDTFFLPPERTVLPRKGGIAVASQSGAFMVDQVMTNFHDVNIGISVAVSMGNKAMVDEVDLLEHFDERADTDACCFYIEGMGRRSLEFCRAAKEVSCRKPVVAYLGGKSRAGQKAASSHTAALAGNLEILSSAMRQNGVIEAKTELEVTSFSKMFSFYKHRPLVLGNIAVLSSSGGHGVIASDLAEEAGLEIVKLDEAERSAAGALLSTSLRDIASVKNPVDLTGSASDDDFERVLDYLLSLERVEAATVLILPYTPAITSFVGTRLGQVVKKHDKPVVAYIPNLAKFAMVLEGFELNGIPVVHSIEESVQMLKALHLLTVCGD